MMLNNDPKSTLFHCTQLQLQWSVSEIGQIFKCLYTAKPSNHNLLRVFWFFTGMKIVLYFIDWLKNSRYWTSSPLQRVTALWMYEYCYTVFEGLSESFRNVRFWIFGETAVTVSPETIALILFSQIGQWSFSSMEGKFRESDKSLKYELGWIYYLCLAGSVVTTWSLT